MLIVDAKIRVFIADDHPVVRQGLTAILALQDGLEVVGEAENLPELLKGIGKTQPDVLVLDLDLEPDGGDETAALAAVRKAFPNLRIVIYTAHDDEVRTVKAVELGVEGFVLKQADPEELLSAIHVVHRGGHLLHATVASNLMNHMRRGTGAKQLPRPELAISPRELQVLDLMALGQSNQKIASELVISERTVKFHVSSILNKLDAENRTAAVLKADREGILSKPIRG